ncbi:MAG TPA: selenium-binding protein SBP56-related protein [Streptosporangiaceae bacterium]|jgi:selenium-binding protein 1|nr:selenium-binding protein SBP56-related protein [Streptosporangiaceae bacterium]
MADERHHEHHQDPTFYRSPRDAAAASPEKVAYLATFSRPADSPDALAVVDVDPQSPSYASVIGFTELPNTGDELHHFGWNACSSALCPTGDHKHGDRRYLIVPGLRSSRLYVFDTRDNETEPKIVKVLGPEELGKRAGYSRPHTVHCGPGAVFVSCLGGDGEEGPGGIALLDHASFEVTGQWEAGRGDQYLAYDVWWHVMHEVAITSEWGTPSMIDDGIVPELLLGRKYGHRLHFWDMQSRRKTQTIDLGDEHQMVLELRPAHDPTKLYGFAGVVVSVEDLSASIWLWHENPAATGDGDRWAATKVITIPAEPAPAEQLPPLLQGFGAVPPLVTDIGLSVDDRFLYVSCWGTGELKQYDVTDPFHPEQKGSVRIGGIVGRAPHPARPGTPLSGGPQMVEVSRDGKRVYFTNSLYGSWDDQFYPDGVGAWMAKLDVGAGGGITFDERFFPEGDEFRGRRVHQVRLQGGDASSDSYCYP